MGVHKAPGPSESTGGTQPTVQTPPAFQAAVRSDIPGYQILGNVAKALPNVALSFAELLDSRMPQTAEQYESRSRLVEWRAGRIETEDQKIREVASETAGLARFAASEQRAAETDLGRAQEARTRGDEAGAQRFEASAGVHAETARTHMEEAMGKARGIREFGYYSRDNPPELNNAWSATMGDWGLPSQRRAELVSQDTAFFHGNRELLESEAPGMQDARTRLMSHAGALADSARKGEPFTPDMEQRFNQDFVRIAQPVLQMAGNLRMAETALAGILQMQRDLQYKAQVGEALDELKKLFERIDKGEQVSAEEKAKALETVSYIEEADSEIEGMPVDAKGGASKMVARGIAALRAGKRPEAMMQRELARALAKAKDPEQKEMLERASAWLSEGRLDVKDVGNMLERDGLLRKLDSRVLGGRRQYGAEVAEIRAIDKQAAGLMKKADELREKARLEKSPAKRKELEAQAAVMETKARQLLRTADAKTKGLLEIAKFEKELREGGAPEPVIKAVRAAYRFYGTVSKWRADLTLGAANFFLAHKDSLKNPKASPVLGALVKFMGIISGPKKDSEIGPREKAEAYVKGEIEPKTLMVESKLMLDALEKAGAPKLLVDGLRAATKFFGTKDDWRGKSVLSAAKFFLANKARLSSPQGKGPLGGLLNFVVSVVKGDINEAEAPGKMEAIVRGTSKVPVPTAPVKRPEAPVVTPVVKPEPAMPLGIPTRPAEAPAVPAARGVAPKQAPKGREKAIGILETRRDALAKLLPHVSPQLRAGIETEIKKTEDVIARLKDPEAQVTGADASGRLSSMQSLEGVARSAVLKRLEERNAPKKLLDEVRGGFASGEPAVRAKALGIAGKFLEKSEEVLATAKALEEAGAPPEIIRSMASAMEFYGKGPGWAERADLIVLNAKTYLKNAAILRQDEGQGALGMIVEVSVLLSNPENILKDAEAARRVIGEADAAAMEAAAGKRELARQTFMTSIVPLSGFLRVEWLKPLAPGIRTIIKRSAEISEKLADPARAAEVSEEDLARASAGITAVGHMADRLEDCPAGTRTHLGKLYAAALDYLNSGGSVETFDLMIFTGDLLMDKRFAPYVKEFTDAVTAVRDAKTDEERTKADARLREVTAKAVATVLGKASEGLPVGAGKSVKSISDGILANPGGATLGVLISAQNALEIVDRMRPRLIARGVPEAVRNEAGAIYGRALDTLANGGASAVVETQVRLAERYLDPAAENQSADDLERDELKKLSMDLDKEPKGLEQTKAYLTLSDDIAAIREKKKFLIRKGGLRAGSTGAKTLDGMLGYLEEKRKQMGSSSPVSEEDVGKCAAWIRDRMATDENARGRIGEIAKGMMAEAAARGEVLEPKEAEDMAVMKLARQKAESDFLKGIEGVKASANGLLGTLEILRKDDRAGATQRTEAIQIYSYAADSYQAGRIQDGAVFVETGAIYGKLNNRDRSEVAVICREAAERGRGPGERLFDGTGLDILGVYKSKSELMPSIITPDEWRNAEAYFDLAILAYRSGNPQAAADIMDLAVLYATWAGVPEKDLPPDLQKKRRETLDFVEANLGDYSKDRNIVKGKRLIDAASAYGPPAWVPDSTLTPPIAAALLAGKPVAEALGNGDLDAGAAAFASLIDEKDRRMGALDALDLERKAGALIGRNADEREAREKRYGKEADWWAKKAAEAGDDALLADYYKTQANMLDRSFIVESVAAAREARAKGVATLEEAAGLEAEAESAASASVKTMEARLPVLIAGFPESERGAYEEAALEAEGDPEKLRMVYSALLLKRAAGLRQDGQGLLADSERIMKGLGAFDRSVRNLNTMREESGRYQLHTGVRISVALTRDEDVDFLGNPIAHEEDKPTRLTPALLGMLRAQASADIEFGAKAVAEQEGVQRRRNQGVASADARIRKASIEGAKTAIANMIEFLPEWKQEERKKQLDDAVAAATREKDPDVSPLMTLYRDVCGDVGMPYMDSEGHLFINLEEDDKKYHRTAGLYWGERFQAADRALDEGAFHVRSEVVRLDKWYSARNLRLSYQQSTGNAEDYVTYEGVFGLPGMDRPQETWGRLPPEKRPAYQKRFEEISKMEDSPEKDRMLDELRMEISREPGFFKPNIWGHNPLTEAGIVPGTEVRPGELKPLGYEKYEAAATPALITTLITHLPPDKRADYEKEYREIATGPEGDDARRGLLMKLKREKIHYPGSGRERTIGDIVDTGYVPSRPGGPSGGYYGLNTLFYFDIEDYDKRIEKAQELAASGDVAGARFLLEEVEKDARRAESIERRDLIGTERRYRAGRVRADATDFRGEIILDPERGDGPRAKFEIGRANAFLGIGLGAYEDSHERDALDWEAAADTNDRARDAMMPKMEGGRLIEGAAPLAMTPDRVIDLAIGLPAGILESKVPGDPFGRTFNGMIRDVRSAAERGDDKAANAYAKVLYESITANPDYFARAYQGMQANPDTAIPTENDLHLQLESDVQGARVLAWSGQRGVAWKAARDHLRLAKDSWYRADSAKKERDEASEDTRWLAEHRAGPGKDKASDALRRAAAADMALTLAILDPDTDYQAYDVLRYGREIKGFAYTWEYDAPTGNWDDKPISIGIIGGEVTDMDTVLPHTPMKPVEYLFHANRLRWGELTSFTDKDLMREMRPMYREKAVEETVIELARYGIRAKWDKSSKSYEISKWEYSPEAMEQAEKGYGHFRLLESKLFGDVYSHPEGWGTDAQRDYLDRMSYRFRWIKSGVAELTDADIESQPGAIVRSNKIYEASVPLEINSDGVLVDNDRETKDSLARMKKKASHYRIYKGVKSFVKSTVGVVLAAPTLGASLTLTIDEGATMVGEGMKMKEARGEWTFRAGLTFGGGIAMIAMPVGGYFTGLAGETAAAAGLAAPISEEALLALPGNAAIVAANDAALAGAGWGSRAFNFMFLPRGTPVAATTWGEKAGRALFGTADMPFAGRILHWTGTAMTVQGGVDMFAALPESIRGVRSGDMTLAEAIFGGVMAVVQPVVTSAYSVHLAEFGYRTGAPKYVPNWKRLLIGMPLEGRSSQKIAHDYAMAERAFKALEPGKRESFSAFKRETGYVFLPGDEAHVLAAYSTSTHADFVAFAKANPGLVGAEALGRIGARAKAAPGPSVIVEPRLSLEGISPDLAGWEERASAGLPAGPAKDAAVIAAKRYIDAESEAIMKLPEADRPAAVARMKANAAFVIERSATDPANAMAWARFARENPELDRYVARVREGRTASGQDVEFRPAAMPVGDPVVAAAFGKSFDKNPTIETAVAEIPVGWLDWVGIKREDLLALAKTDPQKAMEHANKALESHNMVLVRNKGLFLAEVTHEIAPPGSDRPTASVIGKVYGKGDMFSGRHAMYNPNSYTVFLKGKKEYSKGGIPDTHLPFLRETYAHETQHLHDHAAGLLAAYSRTTKGKGMAAMPDYRADVETTAVAREVGEMLFAMDGAEVGKRIDELLASKRQPPEYKEAYERTLKALLTDESDTLDPRWKTDPVKALAELSPDVLRARLDRFIDSEYVKMTGLSFAELYTSPKSPAAAGVAEVHEDAVHDLVLGKVVESGVTVIAGADYGNGIRASNDRWFDAASDVVRRNATLEMDSAIEAVYAHRESGTPLPPSEGEYFQTNAVLGNGNTDERGMIIVVKKPRNFEAASKLAQMKIAEERARTGTEPSPQRMREIAQKVIEGQGPTMEAFVVALDKSGLGDIDRSTAWHIDPATGTRIDIVPGFDPATVISREFFGDIVYRASELLMERARANGGTITEADVTVVMEQAKAETGGARRVPDEHVGTITRIRDDLRAADIVERREAAAGGRGYRPMSEEKRRAEVASILTEEWKRAPTEAEIDQAMGYLRTPDPRTYSVMVGYDAANPGLSPRMSLEEYAGMYLERGTDLIGAFSYGIHHEGDATRADFAAGYEKAEQRAASYTHPIADSLGIRTEVPEPYRIAVQNAKRRIAAIEAAERELAASSGRPPKPLPAEMVGPIYVEEAVKAGVDQKELRGWAESVVTGVNDHGVRTLGKTDVIGAGDSVVEIRFSLNDEGKDLATTRVREHVANTAGPESDPRETRITRLMGEYGIRDLEAGRLLKSIDAGTFNLELFFDAVPRKGILFGSGEWGYSEGNTGMGHNGMNAMGQAVADAVFETPGAMFADDGLTVVLPPGADPEVFYGNVRAKLAEKKIHGIDVVGSTMKAEEQLTVGQYKSESVARSLSMDTGTVAKVLESAGLPTTAEAVDAGLKRYGGAIVYIVHGVHPSRRDRIYHAIFGDAYGEVTAAYGSMSREQRIDALSKTTNPEERGRLLIFSAVEEVKGARSLRRPRDVLAIFEKNASEARVKANEARTGGDELGVARYEKQAEYWEGMRKGLQDYAILHGEEFITRYHAPIVPRAARGLTLQGRMPPGRPSGRAAAAAEVAPEVRPELAPSPRASEVPVPAEPRIEVGRLASMGAGYDGRLPGRPIVVNEAAPVFSPGRFFTPDEFAGYHSAPADKQVYHNAKHSEYSAKMEYEIAMGSEMTAADTALFGTREAKAEYAAQVAMLHDIDPGPLREPGTPANVERTLEWMDEKKAMLMERFGWDDTRFDMAKAMIARTDFPFHAAAQARYESLLGALRDTGKQDAVAFVVREAPVLSEYADKASWYFQSPADALGAVRGLNNEIAAVTPPGKTPPDMLPGTSKFVEIIGNDKAFETDVAIARKFGVDIGEGYPLRDKVAGMLMPEARARWEANLEMFKRITAGENPEVARAAAEKGLAKVAEEGAARAMPAEGQVLEVSDSQLIEGGPVVPGTKRGIGAPTLVPPIKGPPPLPKAPAAPALKPSRISPKAFLHMNPERQTVFITDLHGTGKHAEATYLNELRTLGGERGRAIEKAHGLPEGELARIYSKAPTLADARKDVADALGIKLGPLFWVVSPDSVNRVTDTEYRGFKSLADDGYLFGMLLEGGLPEAVLDAYPGGKITSVDYLNGLIGAYRMKVEVRDSAAGTVSEHYIFVKRHDVRPDVIGGRTSIASGMPAPEHVISSGGRELTYTRPDGTVSRFGFGKNIADYEGVLRIGGRDMNVRTVSAKSFGELMYEDPLTMELFVHEPEIFWREFGAAMGASFATGISDRHEGNLWAMRLEILAPTTADLEALGYRKITGAGGRPELERIEGAPKGYDVRMETDGRITIFKIGGIDTDTSGAYMAKADGAGGFDLTHMQFRIGAMDIHRLFKHLTLQRNQYENIRAYNYNRFELDAPSVAAYQNVGWKVIEENGRFFIDTNDPQAAALLSQAGLRLVDSGMAPAFISLEGLAGEAFGQNRDGPLYDGLSRWMEEFGARPGYRDAVVGIFESMDGAAVGMGKPLDSAVVSLLGQDGMVYSEGAFNGEGSTPVYYRDGRSRLRAKYEFTDVSAWPANLLDAFPQGKEVFMVPLKDLPLGRVREVTASTKTMTYDGQTYAIFASKGDIPPDLGGAQVLSMTRHHNTLRSDVGLRDMTGLPTVDAGPVRVFEWMMKRRSEGMAEDWAGIHDWIAWQEESDAKAAESDPVKKIEYHGGRYPEVPAHLVNKRTGAVQEPTQRPAAPADTTVQPPTARGDAIVGKPPDAAPGAPGQTEAGYAPSAIMVPPKPGAELAAEPVARLGLLKRFWRYVRGGGEAEAPKPGIATRNEGAVEAPESQEDYVRLLGLPPEERAARIELVFRHLETTNYFEAKKFGIMMSELIAHPEMAHRILTEYTAGRANARRIRTEANAREYAYRTNDGARTLMKAEIKAIETGGGVESLARARGNTTPGRIQKYRDSLAIDYEEGYKKGGIVEARFRVAEQLGVLDNMVVLDSTGNPDPAATRAARFDFVKKYPELFELLLNGNLETGIADRLGVPSARIRGISFAGGAARGAFRLHVETPDGTTRNVFLKMEDVWPAVFGRELGRREGLFSPAIYAEDDAGNPFEYSVTYKNPAGGQPVTVARRFGVSIDVHEYVGRKITIRLPDGRMTEITVSSVAIVGSEVFEPGSLADQPRGAQSAVKRFWEMIGASGGREAILESYNAYFEMSGRTGLGDRNKGNTMFLTGVTAGGDEIVTFQPMDMDSLFMHVNTTIDPASAETGLDFRAFNDDASSYYTAFLQNVVIGSKFAAEAGLMGSNHGKRIVWSQMFEAAFSERAQRGAALPPDTPYMVAAAEELIGAYDGGLMGIGTDGGEGGGVSSFAGRRRQRRPDGRVVMYADEAIAAYREAHGAERQENLIDSMYWRLLWESVKSNIGHNPHVWFEGMPEGFMKHKTEADARVAAGEKRNDVYVEQAKQAFRELFGRDFVEWLWK